MSLRVYYEVLNQKGTPALYTDTLANRPAFGFQGRLFVSTDSGQIFEDTGTAWTLVADAGVGGGTLSSVCLNGNSTATGIVITAGGLSSNSITNTGTTAGSILFAGTGGLQSQDNANFFWDDTNNRLGIGTASPGVSLDIHGTGTMVHLNGTSTNNSYLLFQNAGTGKWRIGNLYNAGANTFEIYDVLNATNRLTILNTGATTLNGTFTATSLIKSGGTSAQILAGDGSVITAGTNITISGGTISSSGGSISLSAIGSTPNANAATLTGSVLNLEPASASFGGIITTGTQTFAGAKTFSANVTATATSTSAPSSGTGLYLGYGASASNFNGINFQGAFATDMYFGRAVSSDDLVIRSSGGERVRFTAGGNVLIGGTTSTNSVANLQVFGSTTVSTNNGQIRINDSVTTTKTMSLGVDGTNNVGFIQSFQDGVAYRSLILNGLGGNVGIGTSTDNGAKLEIKGGYTAFQYNSSASGPTYPSYNTYFGAIGTNFSNGGSELDIWNTVGSGFVFRKQTGTSAQTALMTITSGGNVLIGTTTDNGQGLLQVSGGITAGGISLTGEVLSATATLNKGYYHVFTGSTGQTLTLPSPSSNNYQYVIINNTSNTVTVAAATSTNIITTTNTSVASITLIANQRVLILADGNNKYYQIF